MLNSRSCR